LKASKDIYDSDSEWEEEEEEEEEDEGKNITKTNKIFDFPQLDLQIKESIKNLGGKVFIKLNWSSPKDAFWVSNTLACHRLSDVYLLLKSSDFIIHDLTQCFSTSTSSSSDDDKIIKDNFKYNLVVREWIKINPSLEFRCFVKKNELIGISQRDCRSFYRILIEMKHEIYDRIEKFYLNNIKDKFFDDSFVFDVCLGKKTVKLVDFNPFGEITDSLLFSWEELDEFKKEKEEDGEEKYFKMRIIESDLGIQNNTYSTYGKPIDNVLNDIETSDLPQFLKDVSTTL
jgi:hypothetical protein